SRAVAALIEVLGDRVSTADSVRQHHGVDPSFHPGAPPDVVVFPRSTREVQQVVRVCAGLRVPMIPFGAGTSLEGHVHALRGGVCIDLSAMTRIVRVSPEDLDATVEAGVTREQLDRHLRDQGLFFPVDPGANATLGGMASTRASGTNAVRYGTMRDNVIALRVVTPAGEIVDTARRARKSAAGYDLTRLLVGAEGTLGVITEVTVRLHGIPEHQSAAVCAFEALGGAVDAVIETIQLGVPVARIELLDPLQIEACNRYSDLDNPVAPTLFFEFHGSARGVAEQVETVEAICTEHGGQGFVWASDHMGRDRLWKARHDAYWAGLALRPGCRAMTTDVCVPISRLTACVTETRADLDASGLFGPIVGHVGDGNFHVLLLLDPDDPAQLLEAEAFHARLVARALAHDGTCTGEHGVGCGKIDFVEHELPGAVPLMRAIKHALDPHGLMNPGKVLRGT
ncbi:MAG: FAD-binding protein, partial [Myxococcales bacterium]|nr:FAD-binding protein [Myxococcales bacterium]